MFEPFFEKTVQYIYLQIHTNWIKLVLTLNVVPCLFCYASPRRKLLHEWWTESDENDDGDVEQGQLGH